jgi:hypothetical protein
MDRVLSTWRSCRGRLGREVSAFGVTGVRLQVDARTIEKYEKEAKEKNRDSW